MIAPNHEPLTIRFELVALFLEAFPLRLSIPRLRASAANSLASCSVEHSFRSHSTSFCTPAPIVRVVDTNQEFIEGILADMDAGLTPGTGRNCGCNRYDLPGRSREKIE